MEARTPRRLPQFDEPAMKATFAVTLIIDQKEAGLSNGAYHFRTNGQSGQETLRFANNRACRATWWLSSG